MTLTPGKGSSRPWPWIREVRYRKRWVVLRASQIWKVSRLLLQKRSRLTPALFCSTPNGD
jgi:hypothetical protein